MYTANTMASAIEAMGLSLPYGASNPAVTAAKEREAFQAGAAVVNCIAKNIRPRDLITRASLTNAYTLVLALGGSTNAVLHLMAIAREAGVPWTLDDFDALGATVPHLADLKPGGKYVMFDLYRVGGTPAVLRALLDKGMLNGDCPTVTGKTLAENLADVPSVFAKPQKVVHTFEEPMFDHGIIVVLRGNLAPEGAVAKVAGLKQRAITGPAKVFDGEEECFQAIQAQQIVAGDVVVIRGEGPVGGPGMREMLSITGALTGQGLGESRRPHHRRPVQRRHARPRRRPRRARGVDRRPDRARAERRQHHHRRRQQGADAQRPGGGAGGPQGEVEGARAAGRARGAGEVRQARPQRERRRGHGVRR